MVTKVTALREIRFLNKWWSDPQNSAQCLHRCFRITEVGGGNAPHAGRLNKEYAVGGLSIKIIAGLDGTGLRVEGCGICSIFFGD